MTELISAPFQAVPQDTRRNMTFLGIDLGTSEVKLLLIDAAGALVGSAGAPLQVSRPHPLWSEQAPQDWWSALETAVAELRRTHAQAFSEVGAIGLSGQM